MGKLRATCPNGFSSFHTVTLIIPSSLYVYSPIRHCFSKPCYQAAHWKVPSQRLKIFFAASEWWISLML